MRQTAKTPTAARWIRFWLVLIGLMVYAMILVGGATRLTDSGLSITEWEPITGALPPLSDAGWQMMFEKYKSTAEYKLQNAGMSIEEFKQIFWWEWGHRLFGRIIGIVAFIGMGVFAVNKWLTKPLIWRLTLLIALGGIQGAIGWWMVSSGIGETSRVDVAPYRLATHFSLALLIIGLVCWLWLDLGLRVREIVPDSIRFWARLLLLLVAVQMAAGALVAGLDAGRTYTDWPLMAQEFFPGDYIEAEIGIRSLFEGRAATQFNHRILAYTIFALALISAWRFRASSLSKDFYVFAGLVTTQAVWGILTLVNVAPMGLALVHQGLGVIVTLAAVRLVWLTADRPSVRRQRD